MTEETKKSEEEEKCSIAWDVALEEPFGVCDSPEGKKYAFRMIAAILGLSDGDANDLYEYHEDMLTDFEEETEKKKNCKDVRDVRAMVLCKTWQFIEEEKYPFQKAINESWTWMKEKCSEVNVDV